MIYGLGDHRGWVRLLAEEEGKRQDHRAKKKNRDHLLTGEGLTSSLPNIIMNPVNDS